MVARFSIENGRIVDFEKKYSHGWILTDENFQLSENIWFCHGKLPLFLEHINLLKEKIELLSLPIPRELKKPNEILRVTKRLINKNKAFRSGLVNLRFIWIDDISDQIITCTPFESQEFQLSEKGILLSYSDWVKHSGNVLNRFDFTNEVVWNTLEKQLRGTRFESTVICNEKESIAEGIRSNIFFVKGKNLYTPSVDTGCYIDPIRKLVLESALSLKMQIVETVNLTKKVVSGMDEAFLVAEALGMKKIMGIENKRFTYKTTVALNNKLNELLAGS